jgi:hypothetical protein
MAESTPIPRETSQAVRLLLSRLEALAPSPDPNRRDPRSILLAIPHEKRAHVLSVLEELRARAGDPSAEGLASGARLLIEAAHELWMPFRNDGSSSGEDADGRGAGAP